MSTEGERLARDIKVLVQDAEAFIKATAAETSEKVVDLRQRMQQSAYEVKCNLARIEDAVTEKAKPAVTAADEYVRTHPWAAIGVSAMAGLVIGLLASRS